MQTHESGAGKKTMHGVLIDITNPMFIFYLFAIKGPLGTGRIQCVQSSKTFAIHAITMITQ